MYAHNNKNSDSEDKTTSKEASGITARAILGPVLARFSEKRALIAKKSNSILEATESPQQAHENAQNIFVSREEKPQNSREKGAMGGVLKAGGHGDKFQDRTRELAGILRKMAFVPSKALASALPQGRPPTNLVGERYLSWLTKSRQDMAQSRMNAVIPPPIGSTSPAQNQPTATYPGMNSAPPAPAQAPAQPKPPAGSNASHSPFSLGNDGVLNTIGKLSPFKVEHGQIQAGMGNAYGNMPNTPTQKGVG